MDLFEAVRQRRSIRVFKDEAVPEELIEKIIEAAQWAPSACNSQEWRFIVIDNPEVKEKLLKETTAYFVGRAPLLILVLYSNRTHNFEYKDHLLSAAMAIQNMQLAAHALGLGSCCVNNLPPKRKLRNLFTIPRCFDPVSLLCFGYAKEVPKPLFRKNPIDNIISFNKFEFNYTCPEVDYKISLKRFARFLYYKLPLPIRTRVETIGRKFEKRFD
jgi:nitroreductase